jgi:hypothetical protein
MKLWIKCPYPNEKPGEGKWFECKSFYEKIMWRKYNKSKRLPTLEQRDKPC